jgi:hypothetical protein
MKLATVSARLAVNQGAITAKLLDPPMAVSHSFAVSAGATGPRVMRLSSCGRFILRILSAALSAVSVDWMKTAKSSIESFTRLFWI